jgi:GTP pyrophosphokinase
VFKIKRTYPDNKQNPQKKPPTKSFLRKILKEVPLLKQLQRWQEKSPEELSRQEFLKAMKFDFFNDRIFVLTPKGDVHDLPQGSTPVDFAYKVHTDIGNTCTKAKVNGEFQPLDSALHSGDVVQIIIQENKKPSAEWLNFVKTPLAREHIRFSAQAKNKNLLRK